MREWIACGLALFALGFIVAHCDGCALFQEPAHAAEAAYTGALLRCVDEAKSLAESKACRKRVDDEWKITQTATDGGR